jgi:hypothetical protein
MSAGANGLVRGERCLFSMKLIWVTAEQLPALCAVSAGDLEPEQ